MDALQPESGSELYGHQLRSKPSIHSLVSWVTSLDRELVILILLFLSFRISAVLFLHWGGNVNPGDQDFPFYRSMGELSLDGYYPYIHYWSEYPPLVPFCIIGVYRLSLLLASWPNDMLWFQVALSFFFTLFDLGNLVLVQRLAQVLHGSQVAHRAAWIYALLAFPLLVTLGWMDAMPLFFLLLGAYFIVLGRPYLAGIVTGVGLMVKVIPALAVPAALRNFRRLSDGARYLLGFVVVCGLIAGPFLLINQTMTIASFKNILSRSSWQSIWALIEGYFGVGIVLPLADRFNPSSATAELHPSTLPWLVINGIFGLLLVLIYTRRIRWQEPRICIAAVGLTLNLFLIFSKGYSPQYLIYVLAFLVVLMPNGRGVLYATVLMINDFIEYPWAFWLVPDDHQLQWIAVSVRTVLLLGLSIEYIIMMHPMLERWLRFKTRIVPALFILLAIITAYNVGLVANHYREPQRSEADVVHYLQSLSVPDQAIVASSRKAFYQIRSSFPDCGWLLAQQDPDQNPSPLRDRLSKLTADYQRVWLILDQANGDKVERDEMVREMDLWGSRAAEMRFGIYQVIGYSPFGGNDLRPSHTSEVEFESNIGLRGFDITETNLRPGGGLHLAVYYDSLGSIGKDYTVFVHVVDAQGHTLAQRDKPLIYQGKATSQWITNQVVRDSLDVDIPKDANIGEYSIELGVYDSATGQRLNIIKGECAGDGSVVLAKVPLSVSK